MKKTKKLAIWIAVIWFTTLHCVGQTGLMPKLISKDGRHALFVDGEPFFILGVQAHNSSAWPLMLPQLWDAVEAKYTLTHWKYRFTGNR